MIFVDTGYLLAVVNPRDALHQRAQAWSAALSEPLLVTEYVLVETVNALSQPPDRAKAHAIITRLRAAGDCQCLAASTELFNAGLEFHAKRSDKSWSLTDCVSFVVMAQRKVTRALAYDRDFEQAGYEALLRRDP